MEMAALRSGLRGERVRTALYHAPPKDELRIGFPEE
jgi:hypothetical protein